jgi:hypothetical protein
MRQGQQSHFKREWKLTISYLSSTLFLAIVFIVITDIKATAQTSNSNAGGAQQNQTSNARGAISGKSAPMANRLSLSRTGFNAAEFLEPIAPEEYPRSESLPQFLTLIPVAKNAQDVRHLLVANHGEWEIRFACVDQSARDLRVYPTTSAQWMAGNKNILVGLSFTGEGGVTLGLKYYENGRGQHYSQRPIREIVSARTSGSPLLPPKPNEAFQWSTQERNSDVMMHFDQYNPQVVSVFLVKETGEIVLRVYEPSLDSVIRCPGNQKVRILYVQPHALPMS